MPDAASLSQGDLEILVSRELRKAGLVLSGLHVRRRTPLDEADGRYVMLLEGELSIGGAGAPLLVECHVRRALVDAAHASAFLATVREAAGRRGLLVSTSGFAPEAVRLAAAEGIALLAVVDGESAWSSAWNTGRPPSWFPEFVAQLLVAGEAGLVRSEIVQAGSGTSILACLRPQPKSEKSATA